VGRLHQEPAPFYLQKRQWQDAASYGIVTRLHADEGQDA